MKKNKLNVIFQLCNVALVLFLCWSIFFSEHARSYEIKLIWSGNENKVLSLSSVFENLNLDENSISLVYEKNSLKYKTPVNDVIYYFESGEVNLGYFLDDLAMDYNVSCDFYEGKIFIGRRLKTD